MSTLSVESTDVYLLGQHMYIVYKNDAGQEYVIRGGPESDNPLSFGNVAVEVGVPIGLSEDARGDDTPQDRGSVTINTGTRNADDVWHILKDQASDIDSAALDYDVLSQNSNSVISSVLYSAGIDPRYVRPSNAPWSQFVGKGNYLDVSSNLSGSERDDIMWGYTLDDTLKGRL